MVCESQATGPYIIHQLHAQLLSCCQSYDAGYGCCTARLQHQSYAATSLECYSFHRLGSPGRYSSGDAAECQTHHDAQDSCCIDPGPSTGCDCQVQQRSVHHRHNHCTSDLLETISFMNCTQGLLGLEMFCRQLIQNIYLFVLLFAVSAIQFVLHLSTSWHY